MKGTYLRSSAWAQAHQNINLHTNSNNRMQTQELKKSQSTRCESVWDWYLSNNEQERILWIKHKILLHLTRFTKMASIQLQVLQQLKGSASLELPVTFLWIQFNHHLPPSHHLKVISWSGDWMINWNEVAVDQIRRKRLKFLDCRTWLQTTSTKVKLH